MNVTPDHSAEDIARSLKPHQKHMVLDFFERGWEPYVNRPKNLWTLGLIREAHVRNRTRSYGTPYELTEKGQDVARAVGVLLGMDAQELAVDAQRMQLLTARRRAKLYVGHMHNGEIRQANEQLTTLLEALLSEDE